MKILQIVKTNRGALWAFNQAIHLSRQGVEIITVLPSEPGGMAEKYKKNGMKVIIGDWQLPIRKPWEFFSKCKKIRQVVKEVSPDIIHFHFVSNVIMGRIALRHEKTPRLFQVPGPLHLENKLTSFIERCVAKKNDFWAGSCKRTCQYYIESGVDKNKVFLAYYGVPHRDIDTEQNDNNFRNEFGISNDAIIIAMVSYFYKPKKYIGQTRGIKGHEDFIDAMKIVLENNKNVVPVIIGNAWDGSKQYELKVKEYAKSVLKDKVIFTGYRNDIYKIYKDINIVVHPSHSENLGGAAESLMLAVPTISSDVGGFPDIIIPNQTGCLCKAKDPNDLAEKIQWAIKHMAEMKEMAIKGQKLVNDLLDLNNTASKVKEVYCSIINTEKKEF